MSFEEQFNVFQERGGISRQKLRNAMQFQGKPGRDTIFVHCRFREETLGVPINLGLGPVRRFRD